MGILIFNGSTSVTAEHKLCGNWQRCSDVANLGGIKSVSASWYVTDNGERKELINAMVSVSDNRSTGCSRSVH